MLTHSELRDLLLEFEKLTSTKLPVEQLSAFITSKSLEMSTPGSLLRLQAAVMLIDSYLYGGGPTVEIWRKSESPSEFSVVAAYGESCYSGFFANAEAAIVALAKDIAGRNP